MLPGVSKTLGPQRHAKCSLASSRSTEMFPRALSRTFSQTLTSYGFSASQAFLSSVCILVGVVRRGTFLGLYDSFGESIFPVFLFPSLSLPSSPFSPLLCLLFPSLPSSFFSPLSSPLYTPLLLYLSSLLLLSLSSPPFSSFPFLSSLKDWAHCTKPGRPWFLWIPTLTHPCRCLCIPCHLPQELRASGVVG